MIKKSLITGGAGFLGSHLARRLLAEDHEVTVMDTLFTGTKANIYDLMENPRFTFMLHDVTQPFWGQFDEIYNLACPASPIFNTYGPNMHPQDGRVISNFIMQALKNKDITLYGDGSQTRSFQYVDDLINAIRLFMALDAKRVKAFFAKKEMGVPVVNVGNPGEYTIKQLAQETLRQLPESKSQIVYQPLPKDDPKRRKPDITLAQELLGWSPEVPLKEGLARTIAYFRSVK